MDGIIEAALHNLSLDLTGGDEAALDAIAAHTGLKDITYDRAHKLVEEAEEAAAYFPLDEHDLHLLVRGEVPGWLSEEAAVRLDALKAARA
jgi:hypothetical protein